MKLKTSYKPLKIQLVLKDMKMVDLRNNVDVSSSTLAKINKGEPVSLLAILKICEYLNCGLHEVVEFVEDSDETETKL